MKYFNGIGVCVLFASRFGCCCLLFVWVLCLTGKVVSWAGWVYDGFGASFGLVVWVNVYVGLR